jgi:hypothetical protein
MRPLSCLERLGTKYAVTHCHIPEELIPINTAAKIFKVANLKDDRAVKIVVNRAMSDNVGKRFSTFVRPRPGKLFFRKTRARS